MIGGRYRLHALLGEGGMARVFDAFDERLERPVAVKVLRPETEALPGMRRRFQQEARISARLVHPNIVAVLDYGEDGAASYLVMERLPGHTLRDEITRAPIPPDRLAPLMTDTLAALAAAHRLGVLHRDIKPSNILLDEDGRARITDFGIAKSFDALGASDATSDMTMTGVVLGTPGYLAPERRAGDSATVQSDLYAVGAVMAEALSGRRLSSTEDTSLELPPTLRPIVTKALATDPQQRFSSAEEMALALQTRARYAPVLGAPGAVTEPLENHTALLPAPPREQIPGLAAGPDSAAARKRRRSVFAAVLSAIVLALLLLFLLTPGPTAPPHASATSGAAATRQLSTTPRDPQAAAIRRLATSLANGGLPGDAALAASLDNTAAATAGPARETAAQATLALAGVLYDGGGISGTQFQAVASALQPTGATVPTTTVPTTQPPPPAPGDKGAGHGKGGGGH